jgi:Holliday junction resolvase RusA-like endonuclease
VTTLPVVMFIQGVPKAQPRVKFASRGKFATAYTPKTPTVDWKARIALAFVGVTIPAQALRIDWVAVMPRPQGHWRKDGTLRPSAPVHHTAKPDRDNMDKAVMDQLKASGVLVEDAHVHRGELFKRYQRSQIEPVGMYLRISEADGTDPVWATA